MFQDNPLLAQLKQQIQETLPKKEGQVKATEKGFGFLEVDDKTSLFIPPPYMKKVLHGDRVEAFVRTEKDREVAEPDTLVEASLDRFIGRVQWIRNRLNVVPDHPQMKDALRAKTQRGLSQDNLKEGDWVVASLIRHPLKGDDNFMCQVSEKITDADDKIAPWWVTLAKHNLPNQEPAPKDAWPLLEQGLERRDLTDLPFVTIDSESTKDMDDALYVKANPQGGFTMTVAIADPTAYIDADEALDQVARDRGFTIYLPGRNIPMLPRDLSDDLCSLRANEKRPALCCTFNIDADGTIADDAEFFSAWIQSHGQLAYDKVSDYIELGEQAQWQPESSDIADQIHQLHQFALARIQWRETHAVTFPDRPDYRFELSEDNDVIAIHTDQRRIANRIVEESMISANICAGRKLRDAFGFGIFNTHAGFNSEKLDDVVELVKAHDGEADSESLATVEGFSALRRWLNSLDTTYLDNRLRRFQAYSEIGHEPAPHYAMGLDVYATWTSPIRKYGDMINHRLLKAIIRGETEANAPADTVGEELAGYRKHHRMAERDVADWLYTRLLKPEVEAQTRYTAEIFDINRAGMRVRLLENGAPAFIPSSLIIDNKSRIACDKETGTVTIDDNVEFKLGDSLEVVIADIKETTRSIVAKPTQVFTLPEASQSE
ncbi:MULTISPECIES: exoribonuclease II [unclassified Salinivibrio]|uniref:exoribonuclease II n=1 Tax=unclassified Salinivibrio TaxID=2636825 RepID=UPI00128BD158|nr:MULTISPECIES: exoribonuclease II [unclassified Salinivibrio]MPS31229.1 exoribonuclease II [Salinivibrio sp. VYel7]MPX92629.1 exoribonuclease II [Salinivibrio sp. VYel9]MPX96872.1 exoribonuclease II [Salinivibrio sp. VYel6]MPX98862.1 exoribonuclease II [Salinivibrio sp. VYel4]MPY01437.1 exoribonuclease II [Salinivibrio sp. VYel5]